MTIGAILHLLVAAVPRAVRTAEELTRRLHAVTDDAAATMAALGSQRMDGAFEAVEGVPLAMGERDLESLVVLVAANFAGSHVASFMSAVGS
jgi:hypothetical protein